MNKGFIQTEEVEGLKVFTPPDMVQIPLQEYRRYIEDNIKGPTVEIPLQEYDRLREDNFNLRGHNERLEYENRRLMEEVDRRADTKQTIEQGIERIRQEIATKKVSESVTKAEATREREVL